MSGSLSWRWPLAVAAAAICLAGRQSPAVEPLPAAGPSSAPAVSDSTSTPVEWITRVYPVGDLVSSDQAEDELPTLADAIRGCLQPDSWRDAGRAASIATFSGHGIRTLIVSQTEDVHEQILRLLTDLRRARKESPGVGRP